MNDEPEADDQLEDEDFIAEDDSTTFRKPNKLVRNIVLSCVGGLVAVLSVWLVIAVPELIKLFEPPPPPPLTLAQQIELRTKESEKTASWQNFHCNLFHLYYDGEELEVPLGEILGLGAGAEKEAITKRCRELLPTVRLLGGWPNSRPQQDNIVVCDGFRFILKGGLPLAITPRREGLAKGVVHFRLGGDKINTHEMQVGQPTTIGPYSPLVVQADEQCVIIAAPRVGRKAAVPGRVVRVTEATAEKSQYNSVHWRGDRPTATN